jgi:adenylosuccinate synthase
MAYTLSKSVYPPCSSKILIGQLATILDLKSREIGQANKSKSKDQKTLMQELKEVRDSLKSQIKPLIGKLNGLIMDDREIDWRGINGDLIDVSPCQWNGCGADGSLISSHLLDRRS